MGTKLGEIKLTSEFTDILSSIKKGENLFVTGKAGTGKSTLLKLSQNQLNNKSYVVAAPTGVAALNVSGVTIHRLFAFRKGLNNNLDMYRPPEFIKDLDVLIIDEVSMVRADLLDMVDLALKRGKKSKLPFGGVQIILFGDLYQLPPVLTDREEQIYSENYSTSFFFSSLAYQSSNFKIMELTEVFRQKQQDFIEILNSLRDGKATDVEVEKLNSRCYRKDFDSYSDTAITLCNTNADADKMNNSRLLELGTEVLEITGVKSGEIHDDELKTDTKLKIAVGARIMMLTNDSSYVNGSLGFIKDIDFENNQTKLLIKLDDKKMPVLISPYTWEIYKPVRVEGKVEQEIAGSFTQLPIRLAWAVTVHKSQGQTFKEVVYDRGRGTFAEGQLYVALSRCTTLEGLVLHKPISLRDIKINNSISDFFESQNLKTKKLDLFKWILATYINTGGLEFDQCVEIALYNKDHPELNLSTLINPERDLTRAVDSGITASDLGIAPRMKQLESIIRIVLDGHVVIAKSISKLRNLVKFKSTDFDWGIGHSLTNTSEISSDKIRAIELVETYKKQLNKSDNIKYLVKECKNQSKIITPGSYLLVNPEFKHEQFLDYFYSKLNDLDFARLFAAIFVKTKYISKKEMNSIKVKFEVDSTVLMKAAEDVLISLKENASANGIISQEEAVMIESYASMFGLTVELIIKESTQLTLSPGMKVCLTGSPPSGFDQSHLTKNELRKVLESKGMFEVESVTKKCDLVVAFNDETLSRKAKKARQAGIPVVSSHEFLDLLHQLK